MKEKEETTLGFKRRIGLIKRIIENMLPNLYPCDSENGEHFFQVVLHEIRWFLIDENNNMSKFSSETIDFLKTHFKDEIIDYYNKHCKSNIKEQIRKTLRKETELPVNWKRRYWMLDEGIEWRLRHTFSPSKICRFENPSEMMEHMFELTVEEFIGNNFIESDWDKAYEISMEYLKEKYKKDLIKYYKSNCG